MGRIRGWCTFQIPTEEECGQHKTVRGPHENDLAQSPVLVVERSAAVSVRSPWVCVEACKDRHARLLPEKGRLRSGGAGLRVRVGVEGQDAMRQKGLHEVKSPTRRGVIRVSELSGSKWATKDDILAHDCNNRCLCVSFQVVQYLGNPNPDKFYHNDEGVAPRSAHLLALRAPQDLQEIFCRDRIAAHSVSRI